MENAPRPYDLTNNLEVYRLLREVHGFLATCAKQHHGTDFAGRHYAIEALATLAKGDWKVVAHPPEMRGEFAESETI